jgi:4-alpha-glucanotransferase
MRRRGSGILFHITSLPSKFGIGDMGPEAYRFVDLLAEARQGFWQILPLNPTDLFHGNSPYHSSSAFACNPLLISPELLVQSGYLAPGDLKSTPQFPGERVDYQSVTAYKEKLFAKAYERFKKKKEMHAFEQFCSESSDWLDDFVLFMALRSHFGQNAWSQWPQDIRDRRPEDILWAKEELGDRIKREMFLQYVFHQQWTSLKDYCSKKGIQIFGDMPIYVNYDSTDVWAHPDLFKLDNEKRPQAIAGVPPDYFSETGQLWGDPVYRWDVIKERGYDWWLERIRRNLTLYDLLRIDHFRGLVAYWEVPGGETTAINGKWIEAPAEEFFHAILKKFAYAPLVAEDLGIITPDVREIMHRFGFPGMKVLLFAFGDDPAKNPYAPHNVVPNSVMYTGTHDNNTARGWFEKEATPETKKMFFRYLGREITADEVHWELVRLAMMSVANTVIVPVQDLLGLGEEARMNTPSTTEDNWRWRLLPQQLDASVTSRLLEMTEIYGRA